MNISNVPVSLHMCKIRYNEMGEIRNSLSSGPGQTFP